MNTELSKALDEPCCYPTQITQKYLRTPPKNHTLIQCSPTHSTFKTKTIKQLKTIAKILWAL